MITVCSCTCSLVLCIGPANSRRRDHHSADIPSSSLSKHLSKREGTAPAKGLAALHLCAPTRATLPAHLWVYTAVCTAVQLCAPLSIRGVERLNNSGVLRGRTHRRPLHSYRKNLLKGGEGASRMTVSPTATRSKVPRGLRGRRAGGDRGSAVDRLEVPGAGRPAARANTPTIRYEFLANCGACVYHSSSCCDRPGCAMISRRLFSARRRWRVCASGWRGSNSTATRWATRRSGSLVTRNITERFTSSSAANRARMRVTTQSLLPHRCTALEDPECKVVERWWSSRRLDHRRRRRSGGGSEGAVLPSGPFDLCLQHPEAGGRGCLRPAAG